MIIACENNMTDVAKLLIETDETTPSTLDFNGYTALDYAKQGIRCNAICPGWVDTPINYAHAEMMGGLDKIYAEIDKFQPIGRPGEPIEIAHLALFLASDESSFMTGSIVSADGGMTAQ